MNRLLSTGADTMARTVGANAGGARAMSQTASAGASGAKAGGPDTMADTMNRAANPKADTMNRATAGHAFGAAL